MLPRHSLLFLINSLLLTTFAINTTKILSKKTIAGVTVLKPDDKTKLPSAFHQRSKRFLIFEKGAVITITVNMARTILSGTPRGMNYVAELTLSYDLPYTIEMVFGKFLYHRKGTTKTTTTTTTTAKPFIPWLYDNPHEHYYYSMPLVGKNWQQKNIDIKKKIDHSQHVCQPKNMFDPDRSWNSKRTNKWCKLPTRKVNGAYLRRRQKRATQYENIFFDIIDQWANIYGYNGRHCAMRTLCEAQHLLLPAGQSLFHDVIRILIKFSTPRLQQDVKMQRAMQHAGLAECATLYGPHCRLSFLKHFTQAIHGDLM